MSTVTVHRATHLTGIAPQFLVDDLDRVYAGVTRDGFAIHLKHAPKLAADREHRKQNELLDAYISVSGIRGLFSELEIRGGSSDQAA